MSKSALTIVFVVLFVVLVGEVVYLFYFSKPAPVTEEITASLPERQGTQAIKDNVLNYLSYANIGALKSSTLTNRYEGKIIELVNTIDDPNTDRGIKIKFQGENGDVNGFFYNKDEATNRLSVFLNVKDATAEKITVDDLKVGDFITLEESLNLLDGDLNSFVIGITITVLP